MQSEIVNYDNKAKDIYLTIDLEYLPGKTPGLLDVGMGAISLNCSNWAMEPPKDRAITYQGQEWSMIDNGYFVGMETSDHPKHLNTADPDPRQVSLPIFTTEAPTSKSSSTVSNNIHSSEV